MKLALHVLIVFAFGTGAALAQSNAPGDDWTWKATSQAVVVDGDTIKLRGVRIRLAGIDAPEMNQACTADGVPYACGVAAEGVAVLR